MTSLLYLGLIGLIFSVHTPSDSDFKSQMLSGYSQSPITEVIDPCDPDTLPPYWGVADLHVEFFGTCGVDSFLNIWLLNFITGEDECCQPKQLVVNEVVVDSCIGNVRLSTTQAIVLWDGSEIGQPCSTTGSPDGYYSDTLYVTVSLIDTLAPQISGAPANDTILCIDPLPSLPNLTADDVCEGDLTDSISIDSVITNVTCGTSLVSEIREYTATVSDACGNMDTASWSITIISNLELDLGPDQLVCDMDMVEVDCGIAGGMYSWSTGAATQSIVVDTSGVYAVTVTAANGCCAFDSIQIVIGQNLVLEASGGTLTCDEPSVELSAGVENAESYDWSGPGGFISDLKNPVVNQTGEYMITVTGAMGCQASDTVVVDIDTVAPKNVLATIGTVICDNLVVELLGNSTTDGVSYQWTGPNGFAASSKNATTGKAGEYVLEVTAPNGCTATDTVIVDEDITAPNVNVMTRPATNGENGVAWLEVTNGVPPYVINWDNGQMTDTANLFEVGSHFVDVTDANNCLTRQNFAIDPLLTICDINNTQVTTNTTITDVLNSSSQASEGILGSDCVQSVFDPIPPVLYTRVFLFEKVAEHGDLELTLDVPSNDNTKAFAFACNTYPKYNDQICLTNTDADGKLSIPSDEGFYYIAILSTELTNFSFVIRQQDPQPTVCDSWDELISCDTIINDELSGPDRFNIADKLYDGCYRGTDLFNGPEKIYQVEVPLTSRATMTITPESRMGVFVFDYQCTNRCISSFIVEEGAEQSDQISLNSGIYFIVIDQVADGPNKGFRFEMSCDVVNTSPWPPRRQASCLDESITHTLVIGPTTIDTSQTEGKTMVSLFFLSPNARMSIDTIGQPVVVKGFNNVIAYGDLAGDSLTCGYLPSEPLTYALKVNNKTYLCAGQYSTGSPNFTSGAQSVASKIERAPGTHTSLARVHPLEDKDIPYDSTFVEITVTSNQMWRIIPPDEDEYYWVTSVSSSKESISLTGAGDGKVYVRLEENTNDKCETRDVGIRVKFDFFEQELLARIEQTSKGCSTATRDGTLTEAIAVYPNPASNKVTYAIDTPTGYNSSLSVYNILGEIVDYRTLGKTTNQTGSIDVSDWSPGIYLFSFTIDQMVHTYKVVIQTD